MIHWDSLDLQPHATLLGKSVLNSAVKDFFFGFLCNRTWKKPLQIQTFLLLNLRKNLECQVLIPNLGSVSVYTLEGIEGQECFLAKCFSDLEGWRGLRFAEFGRTRASFSVSDHTRCL